MCHVPSVTLHKRPPLFCVFQNRGGWRRLMYRIIAQANDWNNERTGRKNRNAASRTKRNDESVVPVCRQVKLTFIYHWLTREPPLWGGSCIFRLRQPYRIPRRDAAARRLLRSVILAPPPLPLGWREKVDLAVNVWVVLHKKKGMSSEKTFRVG